MTLIHSHTDENGIETYYELVEGKFGPSLANPRHKRNGKWLRRRRPSEELYDEEVLMDRPEDEPE